MRGSNTEMDAMQTSRPETEICCTNGSNILKNAACGELMEIQAQRADDTVIEFVVDVKNTTPRGALAEAEGAQWAAHCIYRVPARIRNLEAGLHAYKPHTVSIGPFHHGDPELLPMEGHKRRALDHVVTRAGKTNARDFIAALEAVAERLESKYMDLGKDWRGKRNRRRFLQVMLTDGCFLLEIMRARDLEDYDDNDPVFGLHAREYTVPCIREDMLKIENQLPLLVLKTIVDVETQNIPVNHVQDNEHYVNTIVLKFMSPSSTRSAELALGLHPLDICRRSMLSEPRNDMEKALPKSGSVRCRRRWECFLLPARKSNSVIPRLSAVKLHKAGIRFFVNSKPHSLDDVCFKSKKASLFMPFLEVDDSTEHMFLNMMAFERLHATATTTNGVPRYVQFMAEILKSASDVKRLCKVEVLSNIVGPAEEVARMFNRLTKCVLYDDDAPLNLVHKEMNEYLDRGCRRKINKWWGHFVHTYFHNPLMAISLLAATVLLALTVVQTVCAVMSLDNDNKDKLP